jgi:hypothetical protein
LRRCVVAGAVVLEGRQTGHSRIISQVWTMRRRAGEDPLG